MPVLKFYKKKRTQKGSKKKQDVASCNKLAL